MVNRVARETDIRHPLANITNAINKKRGEFDLNNFTPYF